MLKQYKEAELYALYDKAEKEEREVKENKEFLRLKTVLISKGEEQLTIKGKIFTELELERLYNKADKREKLERLLGMKITRINRWEQKHFKHQSKNNKELGLASVPYDKGGQIRLR